MEILKRLSLRIVGQIGVLSAFGALISSILKIKEKGWRCLESVKFSSLISNVVFKIVKRKLKVQISKVKNSNFET